MSRQNRTTFGAIGLVLGLVALMLILILTAVHTVGTDANLYFKLQAEYGVLSHAGVTEGELKDIDQRMARYLLGDVGEVEAGRAVLLKV